LRRRSALRDWHRFLGDCTKFVSDQVLATLHGPRPFVIEPAPEGDVVVHDLTVPFRQTAFLAQRLRVDPTLHLRREGFDAGLIHSGGGHISPQFQPKRFRVASLHSSRAPNLAASASYELVLISFLAKFRRIIENVSGRTNPTLHIFQRAIDTKTRFTKI
jgi:hypothetical protein